MAATAFATMLTWTAGSAFAATTTIDSVNGDVLASTNGEVGGASDCTQSAAFSDPKTFFPGGADGSGPFSFSQSALPAQASASCSAGSGTNTSSASLTSKGTISSSGALSLTQQSHGDTTANGTLTIPQGCVDFGGGASSRTDVTFTITQAESFSFSGSFNTTQPNRGGYSLTQTKPSFGNIFDQTSAGGSSPRAGGTLQPGTYEYVAGVAVSNDVGCGTGTLSDNFSYDLGFTVGDGLVVDSTGDEPDANPGDGACVSTAMPPTCTLRAALQELDAGSSTVPTPVTFDLPGGATTIAPASPLPAATRSALIDGTTNPGGRVVISGTVAGATPGLQIDGDGSTVRGLDVEAFDGAGILVQASKVTIGGLPGDGVPCAFPCNVVRSNVRPGVVVAGADSATDRIVGNRLTGNANPEIDLGKDGRTPNDSDDSDTGANGLLNFPVGVLGEPDPVTGKVEISGVDSPADQGDTVDVYAQSSVNAASGAEPADYVGSATVTATGGWKVDRPAGLPAGDNFYSATITDSNDGTSELSPICGDPNGDGNPDSDGDGLCDDWELRGIDYNDDGTIDLPLGSSFGASPSHKDLYLEIDAMQSTSTRDYAPSQGAIDDVVTAFADAPVTNPSGGTGITLHVNDPGEGPVDDLVPEDRTTAALGTGPQTLTGIRDGRGDDPCDGSFGTQAERSSPDCWKLLGARALVFRYALFGYSYAEHPGSSGRALGIGGSTLTVTLGQFSDAGIIVGGGGVKQCVTLPVCSRVTDAATLMHEFGHTLGLHHGGLDDINFKPNYLSVMNYLFQFRGDVPDRPLDYSRWNLPPLNENALFDANGILGGVDPPVRSAVTSEWPTTGFAQHVLQNGMRACQRATAPTVGPIAWDLLNPGEDFDQVRECPFPTVPSPQNPTLLVSADDWSNLSYSFRDQPGALSGAAAPDPEPDQTDEQILERAASSDANHNGVNDLADACREAPGSQFADANGNGFADVCEADMNRLQAFPTQANGAGSGGASGGSGPVTDHTPPVLSKLSARPSVVLAARAHHKARAARLRFTVSEPSLVTFTAELVLPGRRVGKHCVAGRRHGKACTVYRKIAGTLRVAARPGQNTVTFSGRLGARRLKPGRYRLTAIAIDAAGNRSTPARVTITVR